MREIQKIATLSSFFGEERKQTDKTSEQKENKGTKQRNRGKDRQTERITIHCQKRKDFDGAKNVGQQSHSSNLQMLHTSEILN